jgi:hypothetical protein
MEYKRKPWGKGHFSPEVGEPFLSGIFTVCKTREGVDEPKKLTVYPAMDFRL